MHFRAIAGRDHHRPGTPDPAARAVEPEVTLPSLVKSLRDDAHAFADQLCRQDAELGKLRAAQVEQIREAVEWSTVNAGRGLAAELAQDAARRLLAKVQESSAPTDRLRWTIAHALHIGAETAVAWADGYWGGKMAEERTAAEQALKVAEDKNADRLGLVLRGLLPKPMLFSDGRDGVRTRWPYEAAERARFVMKVKAQVTSSTRSPRWSGCDGRLTRLALDTTDGV